jgi:REP element-mobilizing transposase RayT
MPGPTPLAYGVCYHIYNRGTNGENVFLEQRNYRFFLQRYAKYIEPVASTYAYCLLKNHFHFLVQTKTPEEQERAARETLKVSETFRVLEPSQQFANLFNSYAKAFNRTYGRTGSLFEHPFHRVEVTTDAYFAHLITYIHQNPQLHGFAGDFRDWPFSSYGAILSHQKTRVQRDAALARFGGRAAFLDCHGVRVDVEPIASLVLEEPEDDRP